jgi:hypothetical protein
MNVREAIIELTRALASYTVFIDKLVTRNGVIVAELTAEGVTQEEKTQTISAQLTEITREALAVTDRATVTLEKIARELGGDRDEGEAK